MQHEHDVDNCNTVVVVLVDFVNPNNKVFVYRLNYPTVRHKVTIDQDNISIHNMNFFQVDNLFI